MVNWRRVWGMILRHLYNFKHNWDRITDVFYWPAIDMIIIGLTFSALAQQGIATHARVIMIVISSIFWFIVWRGQGDITVNLLEEFWSENLVNIFSAPLKLSEWMLAMVLVGIMKLFLTIIFTSVIAFFFYAVQITSLGFAFIPFAVSLLIMSWAFGFTMAGLFFRNGTNIQTLAWSGAFMLMPFSAVYYPLNSLPHWVQSVSQIIPSMYIFEGIRTVVATNSIPWDLVLKSYALDGVYLILGLVFFVRSFKRAKEIGLAHLN